MLRRFRLDFTFDDEAFELKSGEEDIGENVVVGGANRWAYNTFVNYETFPKGWDRCGNHPVISVIASTPSRRRGHGDNAASMAWKL